MKKRIRNFHKKVSFLYVYDIHAIAMEEFYHRASPNGQDYYRFIRLFHYVIPR